MVQKIYDVNGFKFNNSKDAEQFNQYSKIFSYKQMKEIYSGYLSKIDYTIYAKPEFDEFQMSEIRCGLKKGLDVSIYAKPEYDYFKMWEIRLDLENQ